MNQSTNDDNEFIRCFIEVKSYKNVRGDEP